MPAKFPERLFSDKEKRLICAFYPLSDTYAIAGLFGGKYSISQLHKCAQRMGLKKSKDTGVSTRSAGSKNMEKINRSRTRKRSIALGHQLVFLQRSERYQQDGKIITYTTKARFAWYKKTGRWPKKHEIITYQDGDADNLSPDNLKLSDKSRLIKGNAQQNLPEEIREVIKFKSLITRAINKRRKNERA